MVHLPQSRLAFLQAPLTKWGTERGTQVIFREEGTNRWFIGNWEGTREKPEFAIATSGCQMAFLSQNPDWKRSASQTVLFHGAEFGEEISFDDVTFAIEDEPTSVNLCKGAGQPMPVALALDAFLDVELDFVGRDVLGTAYVTTGTGVNMIATWSEDRANLTLSATTLSHDDWWGYDWPGSTWGFKRSIRELQASYPLNVSIHGIQFDAADLVALNAKRIDLADRFGGLLPAHAFAEILAANPDLSEDDCLDRRIPTPVTAIRWEVDEDTIDRNAVEACLPRRKAGLTPVYCTTWRELKDAAAMFESAILMNLTSDDWDAYCAFEMALDGDIATITVRGADYE